MVPYIIMAILAYALGSINFSVIFSRKFAGFDIREKGSGNAGSTNMLREVGKKAAALTLLCDVLKGVVAILIALLIGVIVQDANKSLLVQIAAILVVVGHTFPIFFEFRGGKGIATSLGILLLVNWKIGLICLVFALVIMAITRTVSIGSIIAAVLFPILTIFTGYENYIVEGNYFIFSLLLAAFVIFNHRENVKRILAGKENKLNVDDK